MWQHSEDKCSIQANDAAIAIVLAQPCERITDAMREINNMHMPLLKKRGNRWLSGGLQKEAIKQKERRKKAQDSAKVRWGKDLDKGEKGSKRNANASIEHSSPSPIPSPIPSPVNINNPKPPKKGAKRLSEKEKKSIKVESNTMTMIRMGDWYNRKGALWSLYEEERLNLLEPIDEAELDVMEIYYMADIPKKDDIRRRALETLLNNWNIDLDRARNFKPEVSHADNFKEDREF